MTGLRPIRSEMPETMKLPSVAEMPSVPMSHPICAGENPRTFVKNKGVNAQQITRYDTNRMEMQTQICIFRSAKISLKRRRNDCRGSEEGAATVAGSSMKHHKRNAETRPGMPAR